MTILLKPIITEKSMTLASRGVYTFAVDRRAAKTQIRQAVETLFQVKVTDVTTSRLQGTTVRTGKLRLRSTTSPVKFARVTLKSGQTISLFDLKEEQ